MTAASAQTEPFNKHGAKHEALYEPEDLISEQPRRAATSQRRLWISAVLNSDQLQRAAAGRMRRLVLDWHSWCVRAVLQLAKALYIKPNVLSSLPKRLCLI